jgi:hypothetical protein
MQKIRTSFALVMTVFIVSCSKEKSTETDAHVGAPGGGAIGANCRINKIIAADSVSGRGLFSLFTHFNVDRASRVEAYDSVKSSVEAAADLVYKGDTIVVGPHEYFITDSGKRLSKFYSPFDPSDPSSDEYVYSYTYDASGYLKEKSIWLAAIPVPIVKFVYTWAGGNLMKIDGNTALPGTTKKVLTAELTYDMGKTAKNFIQVMPDAFETFLFIMAVDIGKKSTNVVKTIRMTTYNENGAPANTYNTLIKDVKFSPDGYITEWYAQGDGFDALGVFNGRTLFKYSCN